MENPFWVNEIFKINEKIKKHKVKEIKKSPREKIVLSSKEDGLLWFEMLKSINEIKSKNEIIKFPDYFEKVCRKFSITKAKSWNCLFFLHRTPCTAH